MLGELSAIQIDRLLRTETVGRIGLHAQGRTYVVPVTYVYDGEAVIGHTSPGLKLAMARQNPEVCFEVDHVENLATWQSVICQGRFEELTGPEAGATMQRFVEHLLPVITSTSAEPTHGLHHHPASAGHPGGGHPGGAGAKQGVVWRIVLSEKTGRFEKR